MAFRSGTADRAHVGTTFSATSSSANHNKRVLHLVETLEIGGTETQVVQTALRQQAMGHQVTVGCLRAEGPLLTLLQNAGIPVIEFRKDKKLFSIQGLRQLVRLTLLLRRQKFHVLHSHDLMSNLLGVPAARLAATPIVISSRRYLDLEWWCGNWRNKVVGWIYKLSTFVIVNSTSIRDLLVDRDGVPPNKIHVIYNGIDTDQFLRARKGGETVLSSLRKDAVLVAVVANMSSPIKGHATLIAGAGHVCRLFPSVLFVLIGDGSERPRIEEQIKESGLSKNFLLLGCRRDIPELLADSDILVLPSESEGLPNAILEGMASGVAVIATSVGGVPDVIENEVTGLLVPPRNPLALSTAILHLLDDQELRQRLARAGHQLVVQQFSFQRLLNSLQALYNALADPALCDSEQRHRSQTAYV